MEAQAPQQFRAVSMAAPSKNRPVLPVAFFDEDGSPVDFGGSDRSSNQEILSVTMIVDGNQITPGLLSGLFTGEGSRLPVGFQLAFVNSQDESVPDGVYTGQTLPENEGNPELWEPHIYSSDLPDVFIVANSLVQTDEEFGEPPERKTIYARSFGDTGWGLFLTTPDEPEQQIYKVDFYLPSDVLAYDGEPMDEQIPLQPNQLMLGPGGWLYSGNAASEDPEDWTNPNPLRQLSYDKLAHGPIVIKSLDPWVTEYRPFVAHAGHYPGITATIARPEHIIATADYFTYDPTGPIEVGDDLYQMLSKLEKRIYDLENP